MLPWLGPWGTGREEAPEEPGLSTGGDQAWSSGEEAAEEQEAPAAGSPREAGRKPLPPPGALAAERSAEAAAPHPPPLLARAPASRTTPLPRRDPRHRADAGPQRLVSGGSREPRAPRQPGPQGPLSSRTLCHPSWPMYDACGRTPTPGRPEEEQAPADAGLPVRSCEDVFCLDPLLPCGQRVPLYLAKPPQQAVGARKLLLPPPIMSTAVHPSSSQACASTWLSEAEVIALAGLLQMSQGGTLASPLTSAGCPDPGSVSEDTGPSGGQSCSESTDPCLTRSPDNH